MRSAQSCSVAPARKLLHRHQGRRQIERARLDVPVVHVLVDRLQRERIALLVAGAVCERERGAVRRGGGDGFALLVLDLGDVAGRADQPVGAAVGMALRDAGLARPAPRPVAAAIAGVDLEARGQALEMLRERVPIERHVVGMHARHPVGRRRELRLAQAQHDAQRRRIEDGVGVDVPVVDAVVERLERERVPLLGRRRGGRRDLPALARRAGRVEEARVGIDWTPDRYSWRPFVSCVFRRRPSLYRLYRGRPERPVFGPSGTLTLRYARYKIGLAAKSRRNRRRLRSSHRRTT